VRGLIQKILYGSVETGVNSVEFFIRLHLLVFYSKDLGLSPAWVGIALSISILWDAAIDPWIGRVSDDFKNKKGTRIHLVMIGAIATALTLAALYHPPAALQSPASKWIFLLLMSLVFNTSHTLFSIPYSAMVGDYTSDRDERSRFIAWRLVFANVGGVLGIAIPGYYLTRSDLSAYGSASWIVAMLVLAVAFLGSLAPPPVKKEIHPAGESLAESPAGKFSNRHPLFQAMANRPFAILLVSNLVVNVALTLNSSMALYYYRMRLELSEGDIQNVLLLFLLIFSLSVPLWIWIGKKLGRKWALISGAFLIGVTNCFIYPFLPPGNPQAAYIWASGLSGLLVGCAVLLDSVLTDVIDYDYYLSQKERFGLYFGVWKFSAKFSRAFAVLLAGLFLDWANVSFPDKDTTERLSLIFGPGVGFFFILAGAILLIYPLNEKKYAEIKAALKLRENQKEMQKEKLS
jgi:GPH family glycoside/pentoside/hexuronide:cation symporter